MAQKSSIEWTDATWNPVTGCRKVSSGCKYCYAERIAENLQKRGIHNYRHGFEPTLQPQMLDHPKKWKKPHVIFVNSMSDLFMEDVPMDYIQQVFEVMCEANWHIYQILTKRAKRLAELSSKLPWPKHVWMGVSIENQAVLERVDFLRKCGAQVKFVSCEPLLGPVRDLDLARIDWVIVGGESGLRARPMREEWAVQIKDLCSKAEVPFFFKQWGGNTRNRGGRILLDRTWDEMPAYGMAGP
jgi:protein gp37